MAANLDDVPAQVLLNEVDDARGDVIPVEGSANCDAHFIDVETNAGYALDFVERQCRLDGRGAVVALGEHCERVDSRNRGVQRLIRDALVDVEFADEIVRELLDDDTGNGHCNALS